MNNLKVYAMKKYLICILSAFLLVSLLIIGIRYLVNKYEEYLGIIYKTRMVVASISNYYDIEHRYPDSEYYSDSGELLGSWRYKILPYCLSVSKDECNRIANKPWTPDFINPSYGSPFSLTKESVNERTAYTNVLAVVGENTIWNQRSKSGITDSGSNCIQLIVCSDTGIGWGEAGDFCVDNKTEAFNKWPCAIDDKWILVVFGDGEVWPLKKNVPKEVLYDFMILDANSELNKDEILRPYLIESWRDFMLN